ncbi:MAG TPA: NAD-dependent succinate-semialdehyde dehydrogenase [bacterium]|nr:NAD-dependent succinate-semialdehyde dehydrogenase [bacterium]
MAQTGINPATGELLAQFEEHTPAQVEGTLNAARDAFHAWRETSFAARADVVRRAAALLREQVKAHALLMTREMGKPIGQARAEVEKCAWVCDYYAEHAERFLAPRQIVTDAQYSGVRYDPFGPVLAVMPWNFPFWQVFRFAAPALMAGNVCLLKHASNVPQCALAIERLWREAGLPAGAFATLLIGGARVGALIADRRVAAVTLTGSEAAGRAVGGAAGKALKKTVLELGGNDPFIVLADADLPRAAEIGAAARLLNSGQSCIAAKRFIVLDAVYDKFLALFAERLRARTVGDPQDEATAVGPLARADLREELHAQVEALRTQGAHLAFGGEIPEGKGYYYPITLLTEARMDMPAADAEIFGPVAVVYRAADEDDAVRLANATRFGLGASVWTRDRTRAERLCARLEAGGVFVNGLTKSDPALPFGGVKESGYGRELSAEGIREFVNVKTVWLTGL